MAKLIKPTIIISAFPACGKSYTFKNFNEDPFTMLDSDSSLYSWIYENGVKTDKRNPNFINDYIAHIKENIGKVDCIFVSSHKDVRKALRDNGLNYIMVYPTHEMKDEMLQRMENRGNDKPFLEMMDKNFDNFVTEIEEENKEILNTTPFVNGYRHIPFFEYRITKDTPYITNQMVGDFLDDRMGHPVSCWWN